MDVPEDKRFWLCDGRVLKNLAELEDALKSMSDDIFVHHVNEQKNDFSNWIKDVIGDENLAEKIRYIDKINASLIVNKRLRKRKKKPKAIKISDSEGKYWTQIERCPYISPVLECFAGGEGHVGCLHPSFHERCEIKQKTGYRTKL